MPILCNFYCQNNHYTSDICHLLIFGVDVKIATHNLCEPDCCCKSLKRICDNRVYLFINGRYRTASRYTGKVV